MDQQAAIERVSYFFGQVLTESDFTAEQEYFLKKHRRHNRYLHGWGVVSGLTVKAVNSSEIIVEPGVALDCMGNEMYVGTPLRVNVPTKARAHFIVLEYAEKSVAPIPTYAGSALAESETLTCSRTRESFRIDIVDRDPASGHRGKGPGTPGCGCHHPMCIARLKKGVRGWRVELRGRR